MSFIVPECGGCGTCEECVRAELDIKAHLRVLGSGAPPKSVVAPCTYVAPDGTTWRARTLERPNFDGNPTELLVKVGPQLQILKVHYSEQRRPGSWHKLEQPS